MKITKRIWNSYTLIVILTLTGYSQEASIKLGASKIGLNQHFTITITIENDRLRQHGAFPDISGFIKRGTSSSTSTSFINGQMTSTQSLTQNYQASKQGTFTLPSFTMAINSKEVRSEGTKIEVGEPIQQRRRSNNAFSSDPFEDFFGRRNKPTEFIDIEAEAFLAVTTDKEEVYIGEGVTATLAFYVAESNQADMRFYDLGTQITELTKKLKPNSSWEESFNIDNINGKSIKLNGKNYTKYRIYQATFYPLNLEDISFPSVGLKMIKYRVAKNPSFFGRNRQEDYETFYSREKTVKVKDLPPHPLKEQVTVGNYRLEEDIVAKEVNTGESLNYQFTVVGEGNISAIEAPQPLVDKNFDIYAPNVQQNINRANARVRGAKSFNFYAIPNEPGEFNLGDYFNWVFFNPTAEKYDTLRSEISVKIGGKSRKNQFIASNDLGDFYDKIDSVDNTLSSLEENKLVTWLVNFFVVLIIGFTAFILFRKPVA